jgi:hypothetical protein
MEAYHGRVKLDYEFSGEGIELDREDSSCLSKGLFQREWNISKFPL